MSAPELRGWTPIRVYWQDDEPMVDWCLLGDERFTDPFFDQTIDRCLRSPFRMLFRHQTPIAALGDVTGTPSAPPAGFVFHMSRCGSTLVSQMLAARREHIVISEAGPIDTVLQSHRRRPGVGDEQRIEWLRGLLAAYGQPGCGPEQRLFVKFDSWSVLDLPLVARAFPDVPWVFLYREPVEVLESHAREPGSQMVPGMLEPELLGLDRPAVGSVSLGEYAARVLAAVCAAAVQHHTLGRCLLVNYADLPSAVGTDICPLFGVTANGEDLDRMAEVAQFHVKRPLDRFEQDSGRKQQSASPQLRELAREWVDPWYEQLEALRR
jgi:hypothetical protein